MIDWNQEPRWDPKRGLRMQHYAEPVALGTYQRIRGGGGKWRLRVKRRTGGHTWRNIDMNAPIIKRIKMEALLLGVQL